MDQHVREAVETFTTRIRRDLEVHLGTLTSDLLRIARETQDARRAELEREVSDARAEAERSYQARLETLHGDLAREMDARLAAERATSGIREGRVDALERLLAAVRRIDEAASLSGILEALAKAAAETSRVAILLVENDRLKVWGHFGFAGYSTPVDVSMGQAGVLAAAVTHRQTSLVQPLLEERESAAPAFMRIPVGHHGLVTPIVVAGEVVAMLYADDVDRVVTPEDAPLWTREIELLVRHASGRLENVTSERTVEVLTRPV